MRTRTSPLARSVAAIAAVAGLAFSASACGSDDDTPDIDIDNPVDDGVDDGIDDGIDDGVDDGMTDTIPLTVPGDTLGG